MLVNASQHFCFMCVLGLQIGTLGHYCSPNEMHILYENWITGGETYPKYAVLLKRRLVK